MSFVEIPQIQDEEYGCLFCRTGYEYQVLRNINTLHGLTPVIAERLYRRRISGGMENHREILFPGYIFFRARTDFPIARVLRYPGVLRILQNAQGGWPLIGRDRTVVSWIFENNGLLGYSSAYYVGDRIRIIDGPLKNYEAIITKVNKRFQNGQVKLDFDGKEFVVWLGFNIISKTDI